MDELIDMTDFDSEFTSLDQKYIRQRAYSILPNPEEYHHKNLLLQILRSEGQIPEPPKWLYKPFTYGVWLYHKNIMRFRYRTLDWLKYEKSCAKVLKERLAIARLDCQFYPKYLKDTFINA